MIANRKISKFEKKTIQESPNLKLLMQIMQSISSLLYVEQIGGMKLKKVTATAFFFFGSDGPDDSVMKRYSRSVMRLRAGHYGKTCIHISALKTFFRRVYISFRSCDSEFLLR